MDAVHQVCVCNTLGTVFGLTGMFHSLGLAAYIYSLDGSTSWYYLTFAASSFGGHSYIATIQVAQAIIGDSRIPSFPRSSF